MVWGDGLAGCSSVRSWVRRLGIGEFRVRDLDIGEFRVRLCAVWARKTPLDGQDSHPGCADGRNTNPGCVNGQETNPLLRQWTGGEPAAAPTDGGRTLVCPMDGIRTLDARMDETRTLVAQRAETRTLVAPCGQQNARLDGVRRGGRCVWWVYARMVREHLAGGSQVKYERLAACGCHASCDHRVRADRSMGVRAGGSLSARGRYAGIVRAPCWHGAARISAADPRAPRARRFRRPSSRRTGCAGS